MQPKIVVAYPPNIEQITAAFPDATKPGVIFAYGDTIYNPGGQLIVPPLLMHERVHCERQVVPEGWWELYIRDPEYRYREEMYAHVAEFREQAKYYPDRNLRTRILHQTAQRLIAPLYSYDRSAFTFQKALVDLQRSLTS